MIPYSIYRERLLNPKSTADRNDRLVLRIIASANGGGLDTTSYFGYKTAIKRLTRYALIQPKKGNSNLLVHTTEGLTLFREIQKGS